MAKKKNNRKSKKAKKFKELDLQFDTAANEIAKAAPVGEVNWEVNEAPPQDDKEKAKRQKERLKQIAKDKAAATAKGEPFVAIINIDVDYDNLNSGSFELDWNDHFVTRLMKAGYQGREDADLVDQWFNAVCRNVVLETYEQEQADAHPVRSRKLDNNRREYK